MNESVLIGRAEKFLAQVKQKKINIEFRDGVSTIVELYNYLSENLETLIEFRDNMELKGYKAPYSSIMKYGRSASVELKADDKYDVSRHTQHFRMKAAAKKNILDRVKSSIASHKIALGHLEEYGILECEKCSNKFRNPEWKNLEKGLCSCGADLSIISNKTNVARLEIIPYLPLSGDYMVKMSELSPLSREAFRSLVRLLKQEKRGIVKTLSLVVKVLEDGRWVRKRVNLDAQEQLSYERKIRKKYGPNARIEFMQFHRKKPTIINDKHVQNALALGYVTYCEKKGTEILPKIFISSLHDYDNTLKYQEAVRTAQEKTNQILEDWEEDKDLFEELKQKELQKYGLLDENDKLKNILKTDLKLKQKIREEILINVPKAMILWDLMLYFLSTSPDGRKQSRLFPYIRPKLDSNQLKAFQEFPTSAVKYLQQYYGEAMEPLTNLDQLISYKFEIETKTQGLHLKMDSSIGAAIINIKGGVDDKLAAQIFGVTEKQLNKGKNSLETFQKPTTRRAQRFLEMVQG